MKNNISNTIILSILMLLVIVAIGCAMGLQSFTLVEWWRPAAVCAFLAILPSIWIAKLIRPLASPFLKYLEYPASYILSFSILLAAFYSLNFWMSDSSSRHTYEAPVVRKYSQQRTRSHKTGRRGYKEEKYTVYIVEIEMEDGKIKKMEKPLSEYNRIKKGSNLSLFIEDGLFSIPVIKPSHSTI